MAASRQQLIGQLEQARSSHLVCFVTQTRPNTNVQMGMDVIPRLFEHVKAIGTPRDSTTIDLLIHSNGGDGVVPWRLVTLIREYCKTFNVIVPNRAFSAATLVALGADAIVMHPMGVLGPTDPTVANEFNPAHPQNPALKLGISVEDVYSYIALIKEDVGIKGESDTVQAFRTLTEQLHPLALGNVKRFSAQSRMMAKKLLQLHMNAKTEHSQINEIADTLTSKLYFHGHPINRKEALDLGLKIENANDAQEPLIWEIYSDIAREMKLDDEFNHVQEFIAKAGGAQQLLTTGAASLQSIEPLLMTLVESSYGKHTYSQEFLALGGRNAANLIECNLNVVGQGWTFTKPQPVATTTKGTAATAPKVVSPGTSAAKVVPPAGPAVTP